MRSGGRIFQLVQLFFINKMNDEKVSAAFFRYRVPIVFYVEECGAVC